MCTNLVPMFVVPCSSLFTERCSPQTANPNQPRHAAREIVHQGHVHLLTTLHVCTTTLCLKPEPVHTYLHLLHRWGLLSKKESLEARNQPQITINQALINQWFMNRGLFPQWIGEFEPSWLKFTQQQILAWVFPGSMEFIKWDLVAGQKILTFTTDSYIHICYTLTLLDPHVPYAALDFSD